MRQLFAKIAHSPAPIRLGAFLITLLFIWLPFAIPIALQVGDRNLETILTMGLLFAEFLILLPQWGKQVYQQPRFLQKCGLIGTRSNGLELLVGLNIGLIAVFSLFTIQGLFGWIEWQSHPHFIRLIFEGFLSALGVGFAEELVFRGWLLNELQRDYSPRTALWIDASLFAFLHFLKPWQEMLRTLVTFPALLLLGLTLVLAKRTTQGRLGLSIGLHTGLVWGYYLINVGQLVAYSETVPRWITGIDGNPLASLMGLLFLSGLVWGVKTWKNQ